jgi:hypothetical protein
VDWKPLYGILVGDHLVFSCRPRLGSMGSRLCQESNRHYQGTPCLNFCCFKAHRHKSSHLHSFLASLSCYYLLDCATDMATVSLVYGSVIECGSQYVVPHCSSCRLQTQLHQGNHFQFGHALFLHFLDCHSVHYLSFRSVHVLTHGRRWHS